MDVIIERVYLGYLICFLFVISSISPMRKLREKQKNSYLTEDESRRLSYLNKLFLGGVFGLIVSIYCTIKYYFS